MMLPTDPDSTPGCQDLLDPHPFAADDDDDHWKLLCMSKFNDCHWAETFVLEITGVGCLVRVVVSKAGVDEDGEEIIEDIKKLVLSVTFVPGCRLEIKGETARLVKI